MNKWRDLRYWLLLAWLPIWMLLMWLAKRTQHNAEITRKENAE